MNFWYWFRVVYIQKILLPRKTNPRSTKTSSNHVHVPFGLPHHLCVLPAPAAATRAEICRYTEAWSVFPTLYQTSSFVTFVGLRYFFLRAYNTLLTFASEQGKCNNCSWHFFGAGEAAAVRQRPMTKAKRPASGGVKKKQVDGDYKKRRRKPVPSKALATGEKAAAATALATTAAVTNITKPKRKPVKECDGRPTPPSCKRGFRMVWRVPMTAMMRREQGRQNVKNGRWIMIKSPYVF